jgi:Protein of unknown function (DUF5132)
LHLVGYLKEKEVLMALFEEGLFANGLSTSVIVAVGAAAIVAPVLLPVAAAVVKPLAKGAIRTGIMLYDKGNEAIAEVGEVIEDLVAEVKSEVPGEARPAK